MGEGGLLISEEASLDGKFVMDSRLKDQIITMPADVISVTVADESNKSLG